ncbi:MAG TPA: hypothetical protein H9795_10970 [Candidatus Fournierella merdigallinarum]|nr:hypothetical protein [Candidatus Fournierella merdigallinarum]
MGNIHKPAPRRALYRLLLAAAALVLFVFLWAGAAGAEGDVIEVWNYDDLKAQAFLTTDGAGNQNFEDRTIRLMADIQVPTITDSSSDAEIAYATCIFGSEEHPFKGTFDGNGHTITGLYYKEVWNEPKADTGLFAATDGAVIKNLTIEKADIESDMRGGIVVGYANNTLFDNVNVKNSALSVAAADNVLLIGTDLGIRGGGIAGQIVGSVMYNCEVNNCWIRTNNTSAVAALAGKPLTLGGLVGCAEGSTIEYCRVIGDTPYDENAPTGTAAADGRGKTLVKIYYDVAVGAVGGNTLYVGGIAGRIWSSDNEKGDKGTAIIDCFSTAQMDYYCATYVSVLGVNVGHIGGITAEVWDDNCTITRCHYAGKATSYQYNALLVIPIIQHDVNVSGVADMWQGKADAARRNIYGSFFKISLNGSNRNAMTTLGDGLTGEISSNGNFGPWSDTLYVDRAAWETFDFDFTGTTARTSDYDARASVATHSNKWVMDYELGIPVHGSSVAATFDFPGAGRVEIDPTDLVGAQVATEQPYSFAVQGVAANEQSITMRFEPNSGYRLSGWYRIPDILDDGAPQSHSCFRRLYNAWATIPDVPVWGAAGGTPGPVTNPVSASNVYAPTNTEGQLLQWQDNDLFVARVQALVEFYNYNNALVDLTTGAEKPTSDDDDWYFYEDPLPAVQPQAYPDGATLLGWTTRAPDAWGENYTYAATRAATLQDLKNSGEFYEAGMPVTATMELYPVYAGIASNAITEFEGYQYDVSGAEVAEDQRNRANRQGVGTTSASVDLAGGPENASIALTVTGQGTDGAFPDGYRFLGWYEDGHCVSREQNPTLTGVDLTAEHVYQARFEYQVEYEVYSSAPNSEFNPADIYATIWHKYEEPFQAIEGPNFYRDEFRYWGTSHDYKEDRSNAFAGNIVAPERVYSCNESTDSSYNYSIDVLHDFPGAGTISITSDYGDVGRFTVSVATEQDYNFVGWSFESNSGITKKAGTEVPSDTFTILSTTHYAFFGHYTANVRFHAIDGDEHLQITRRYDQNLFAAQENYTYPYYLHPNDTTNVSCSTEASPTDESMKKDGYVFLGWVDGDGLVNADDTLTEEGRWLWDRKADTDEFLTSDPARALLYRLDESTAKVYSAMDLYPVYAKYDITYTTNFAQQGITATETYNVPELPSETSREPGADGVYSVSFTVSNDETPVLKNDSSAGNYIVVSVELVNNGTGERTTLTPNTDGSYTAGSLLAGTSYTVVANYKPIVVLYHLGGESGDQVDPVLRQMGDELGKSPAPQNTAARVGSQYVFLGWTAQAPAADVFHNVQIADAPALVSEDTLVNAPMELWPVYVQAVSVVSNIDNVLPNAGEVRLLTIPNINLASGTLSARENVTAGSDHYVFMGWYSGYVSDDAPGTLLTANNEYTLGGAKLYEAGVTYTAVYEPAYTVTYHGDETDETVYTVLVPRSEQRTFISETQLPDENGNMTTVSAPIDAQAFADVQDHLGPNQVFREWQWVDENGGCHRWSEFCNTVINCNMDLYPVTLEVTAAAKDGSLQTTYRDSASAAPIDQTTLEVKIGLGTSKEGGDTTINSVTTLVMSEYAQDAITVSVREMAYKPGDAGMTAEPTPMSSIPVTLMLRKNADLTQTDSAASRRYGTLSTNGAGDALFRLTGSLSVTKQLAADTTARPGDAFLVGLTLGTDAQTLCLRAGETMTVSDVPYGLDWQVQEDEQWAWRYQATCDAPSGRLTSYHDTAAVNVTNTMDNEKWFDANASIRNVFGAGATAAP